MIDETNTSNDVVEQPSSELDRTTTTGIFFLKNDTHQRVSLLIQMHLPYIGVAHVINETNTSNGIVEHPTSELNERTTDDFDDSWLHHNDSFQLPRNSIGRYEHIYRAYGIIY